MKPRQLLTHLVTLALLLGPAFPILAQERIDSLEVEDLRLPMSGELTIASGSITRAGSLHTVDTEGDASSDALATITGGAIGDLLIIYAADDARTVVLDDAAGNILCAGSADITLDQADDWALLIYDGSNWLATGFTGGSGGGGVTDFTGLGDVPGTYTGAASQLVRVNGAETALEFVGGGSLFLGRTIGDYTVDASPDAAADYVIFYDSTASTWDRVLIEDLGGGGGGDTLPIVDSTAVVKGSDDATKLLRFEADGITTGTTRVVTMADQNIALDPATGAYLSRKLTDYTITPEAVGSSDYLIFYNADELRWDRLLIEDLPVAAGDTLPIVDSTAVVKGSADATKLVRIEADSLTTATTRVLTMADQDVSLVPGTTFQAADAQLTDVAGLAPTKGRLIVGDGTNWIALGVGTNDQVLVADSAQTAGVKWATGGGSGLANVVEDLTPQLGGNLDGNAFSVLFDDGTGILDSAGNELVLFDGVTSAVNYLEITNAATTGAVSIAALGTDDHVRLNVAGKGVAPVRITPQIEIPELDAGETPAAGHRALYAKSGGIFMKDSSGTETELSGGGGGGDTLPIADTTGVVKGSADATKIVRIEADGITTGTTRVITMADADISLVPGTTFQAVDGELTALAGLTSASDSLPYFTGSGTASLTTFTAAGRAILDDADDAAQRTTLGLGSMATQASGSVSITGGSISGITDLAVADGGTGASDASGARTNLGLVIGTNVQAQDGELTALAGLTSAADALPYFTGSGTASLATFTAAGRAILDDADATAQRATLGLVIGTNVQAYDADLDDLADGTLSASKVQDSFLLNTGDVGTGVYDFGGATLEIPNSATPTVDAAGEIALDTTITDYTGMLRYHDGTEELIVLAVPTANLGTTDGHVVTYDAAANELKLAAPSGGGGGGMAKQSVSRATDQTVTEDTTATPIVWDSSGVLTLQANTKHVLFLNGGVTTVGSGNGWRIRLTTSATIDLIRGHVAMDDRVTAQTKPITAVGTDLVATTAVGAVEAPWSAVITIHTGGTGGTLTVDFASEVSTSGASATLEGPTVADLIY